MIEIDPTKEFKTIMCACNYLGQNYKGARRAFYKSKKFDDYYLWFPKNFETSKWNNNIGEKQIMEECLDSKNYFSHKAYVLNDKYRIKKRIVFAQFERRGKYKFHGIFKVNVSKTEASETKVFYDLINDDNIMFTGTNSK